MTTIQTLTLNPTVNALFRAIGNAPSDRAAERAQTAYETWFKRHGYSEAVANVIFFKLAHKALDRR